MSDVEITAEESGQGAIDIQGLIDLIMGKVDAKIVNLKGEITEALIQIGLNTQDWLTGITDSIRDWLEQPLSDIESAINLTWDSLQKFKDAMNDIVSSIMATAAAWFDTAIQKITGVFDDVYGRLETLIETVKDAITGLKDAVINGIKLAKETVMIWLTDIVDGFKAGLKWLGDRLKDGIQKMLDKIWNTFSNIYNFLKSGYENLKGELTAVYDRSIARIKEIMTTVKESIGDAIDFLVEFFKMVWEFIKEILDELRDLPEDLIAAVMLKMLKIQKGVVEKFIQEERRT